MRFAKNTQHDTSKVLRLPRKMAMDTSKVLRLLRKLQHIFWKRRKSIAPATQNDFRHVPEHVWMSRSATPATRNEAKTRLKPPKRTTSVKLPIGTAIRSSRGRLRTVANGCGRLRPQTQRRANTPSTPRPPEWNGNPCYAFGKTPVPFVELPSIFFLSKTYIPRIVTLQRFLLQGQKGHRNCQKAVAEFSRVSQSNDCESSPNGEDNFQWIDVLCGTTCTRIHTRAFGYWKQVAAGARNMFNTCIIYICISICIYLCYI